jgi:multidrug resistance efflux pump
MQKSSFIVDYLVLWCIIIKNKLRMIMKYFILAILASVGLNATIYYAKVEPVQKYSIKSAASGKIISSKEYMEGRNSTGSVLIHIDDFLNKQDLISSKKKLNTLKEMIRITDKNLQNAKKVANIREKNYSKIKNLKTKSRVEKDNELINSINAQNQVLTLLSNLENLKTQLNDQNYKIATLKDLISKKNIRIPKGYLIYKLYLKKGDFAGVGTPLVDAYDTSHAKLTVFVSKEDYDLAQKGIVYIDGKPTNYKVNKLWNTADTQNISSYKAEIVIPAPKVFSRLVKVEFKAR